MPIFDRLQARCVGGSPGNPSATTAASTAQQLTGAPSFNPQAGTYGTSVGAIDLGVGSSTAGTPGAGWHRPLYLHVIATTTTGTSGFQVTVASSTAASGTSLNSRFVTPVITASGGGWYCYALPNIPERYAYITVNSSSGATATVVCAIADTSDSRAILA